MVYWNKIRGISRGVSVLFFFGCLIISMFTNCNRKPNREYLIGAWKVDSAYTYYNGFEHVKTTGGSDWATYVYGRDGIMKEIKYDSYQSYTFEWCARDSIRIRSTKGGDDNYFKVLRLGSDLLTLKKDKDPIFKGENQNRFEVRYMSRTEIPQEDLQPFDDPRN